MQLPRQSEAMAKQREVRRHSILITEISLLTWINFNANMDK